MSLDCYPACANCKGKTVEKTDLLNVCNKCGMVPKKDHCSTQRKSKLLLSVAGGGYMTLTAFGHLLTQITDSETVTVSLCSFFWIYTHKQCLQKVTHRKTTTFLTHYTQTIFTVLHSHFVNHVHNHHVYHLVWRQSYLINY